MLDLTLLIFALRFAGALIGLAVVIFSVFTAINKYKASKIRKKMLEDKVSEQFLKQYNKKEISSALQNYVRPFCSPADPSSKEREEHLADTREPIFSFIDRNVENTARSYHLLLADTGMGKTSFCLNYYAHCRKKYPNLNVALISLAGQDPEKPIRGIRNKSETILLLDALDEDSKALTDGKGRLFDLLETAADFKMVVITCRSQYFLSDDYIPWQTPLAVIVPRQLGQSPTFSLTRSYISPFGKAEIQRYLAKHFPLYVPWRLPARRRAQALIKRVPDLVHRPMLLERLPELAKQPTKATELFDLYDHLVDGWIARESRWIAVSDLMDVSLELALHLYSTFTDTKGRIPHEAISTLAERTLGKNPNWKHLTARSLLNRDSRGNFKFAHKSIMEFLVVKAACLGDDRALETSWTPFMKELFISWGHSANGKGEWRRAQEILRSDSGRQNIAPLFDMFGTNPVRGLPDFKRCAERKYLTTGARVAPASWRSSSVEVLNQNGRGIYLIRDREYNLEWTYFPNPRSLDDRVPVQLNEVLRFVDRRDDMRLPSYEQFLSLIEGLYRIGNLIIPEGVLFTLGDKPSKNDYLLAQFNSPPLASDSLKVVDKQRRILGTGLYVNCYKAGLSVSFDYANSIETEQLYILDSKQR